MTDFTTGHNDVIDLRNLLETYDSGQDAIADFVSLSVSGGNTTLSVDSAGTGNYTDLVTLSSVSLTQSVQDLVSAGHLVVE
ncbi:MAG: type I secretion C-terminal target domain-containing protein [Hyphomicrobium sp.]|nr:type I secretion C-terminal target domain-containing protein [Hyphomicrobium sp.]